MRQAIYAAAITLLLTGEARAVTGNKLNEACQGADPGFCLGFVLGTYEALGWARSMTYCIPEGVTSHQLRDVVRRYLQHHPENRHLPAAGLVTAALVTSFPC